MTSSWVGRVESGRVSTLLVISGSGRITENGSADTAVQHITVGYLPSAGLPEGFFGTVWAMKTDRVARWLLDVLRQQILVENVQLQQIVGDVLVVVQVEARTELRSYTSKNCLLWVQTYHMTNIRVAARCQYQNYDISIIYVQIFTSSTWM